MIPFPNQKYRIIYADPPWRFSSKELGKTKGKRFHPLEKHYQTQTRDWIQGLPVQNIVEDDAALFLWVPDTLIPTALNVITSWGFKYITIAFVWEKVSTKGKTIHNLGAWTMKNYEMCLLATRGRMLQYKRVNNIPQKTIAVRTKHSRKPAEVRGNIERLFGCVSRIELFARERYVGWDAWGDEV